MSSSQFNPFKGRNLIKQISNFKVRTKDDMIKLIRLAIASIVGESKEPKYGIQVEQAVLPAIMNPAIPEPKDDIENKGKFYPNLFKSLRANAQGANALETDKAILSSASWYYYNMEKPKDTQASIVVYGTDEDNPIVQEQKKKETTV